MSDLPSFRLHRDPVSSGAFEPTKEPCDCCNEVRGYVYVGPQFGPDEEPAICPWCVSSGRANRELGVEFADEDEVPGTSYGDAGPAAPEAIEELVSRTPNYTGWQGSEWPTCCNDVAVFEGPAGAEELDGRWSEASPALDKTCGVAEADWPEVRGRLAKDGDSTAYVFRCSHCGQWHAHWDAN